MIETHAATTGGRERSSEGENGRQAAAASRACKKSQAQVAFAQVMAEAARRGFYGTVGLVLSVQDGSIQHIRVESERMIK